MAAENSPQPPKRERRWFLVTDGWRPDSPGEVRLAQGETYPGPIVGVVVKTPTGLATVSVAT